MSKSKLVKIGSYANQVEAEHIQSLLEEQGIETFVEGGTSNTAMSYVGSAIGGVKLLAKDSDVESVKNVLATLESDNSAGEDWFCAKCEDSVDGSFEVCWSCGGPRNEVEGEAPPPPEYAAPLEDFGDKRGVVIDDDRDLSNPYSPSGVVSDSGPPAPHEPDPVAEDMAQRAFRASWIGMAVMPFLLNFYSLYLQLRLANGERTLSDRANRLWYWALGINVVAVCGWLALLQVGLLM